MKSVWSAYGKPTRRAKVAAPDKPTRLVQPEPPEITGTIQGKTVDSVEEWRVSKSLDKLGIEYVYQKVIAGGNQLSSRDLRGVVIVDFEIYNPFAMPLQLHGGYWHTGIHGSNETFEDAVIFDWYKMTPIIIWDFEVPDQATCDAVCRVRLA